MSALASAQLLTFWGAVCLGMKLAAAYALPAALREELHFSWQLESLLDLLYFTAAGLSAFSTCSPLWTGPCAGSCWQGR